MYHSFASNHIAWKREFQNATLIMPHKHPLRLRPIHTMNTQEDAEKYFNIYPGKESAPLEVSAKLLLIKYYIHHRKTFFVKIF